MTHPTTPVAMTDAHRRLRDVTHHPPPHPHDISNPASSQRPPSQPRCVTSRTLPLIRDRIAIARPTKDEPGMLTDVAGFAVWASVSEEVDLKIRDQTKAGTFPIRLKPEDWQSGSINWLLDVIAPDRKTTGRVIANFRQVVKEGDLRLHPQIAGLVEPEMLEKIARTSTK